MRSPKASRVQHVEAAFVGIAGGERDDAGAERQEEAEKREHPDEKRAGTGRRGGGDPADAEDGDDVEEGEIAKAQGAFERGGGRPAICRRRNRRSGQVSQACPPFASCDRGRTRCVVRWLLSASTAMAALRPLMAMTLPPGCVQAPHR